MGMARRYRGERANQYFTEAIAVFSHHEQPFLGGLLKFRGIVNGCSHLIKGERNEGDREASIQRISKS